RPHHAAGRDALRHRRVRLPPGRHADGGVEPDRSPGPHPMNVRGDTMVAGGYGGGWEARAGELITIIDLEGEQTGDFVAFVSEDPEEWLSPVHCREVLRSIFVRAGDVLVSNRRRPVLE